MGSINFIPTNKIYSRKVHFPNGSIIVGYMTLLGSMIPAVDYETRITD